MAKTNTNTVYVFICLLTGGGIHSNTKVVDLGQPASTICTNKDGTRAAVAGRKSMQENNVFVYFKLLSLPPPTLSLSQYLSSWMLIKTIE